MTLKASFSLFAIRGTEGFWEWYDDIASIKLVPSQNFHVGDGFQKIFSTMKIVLKDGTSTEQIGPFEKQVAAAVKSQVVNVAEDAISLTVCAHSLGGALATLFVARNAQNNRVQIPLLCTFASPRVGDQSFVNFINGLPVSSWKVANEIDWVPKLPPKNLGFVDIKGQHEVYNDQLMSNPPCCHYMNSYLFLLGVPNVINFECDKDQQPGPHWQTS